MSMDLRVQTPVFWVSVLFGCALFFMPLFKKKDDQFYPVNDFKEDISKIYSDLGAFSQRRGDFQSAIKSYTRALAYKPEHSICLNNIKICKKKLKKNISNAVELFTKLE
jgi:hypothetical protein